jgi:hypothetical protein
VRFGFFVINHPWQSVSREAGHRSLGMVFRLRALKSQDIVAYDLIDNGTMIHKDLDHLT